MAQHLGQETPVPFILRDCEASHGRSSFDDFAKVHNNHPIDSLADKAHLMRDANHRHPLTRKAGDEVQHFGDNLGGQGGSPLTR